MGLVASRRRPSAISHLLQFRDDSSKAQPAIIDATKRSEAALQLLHLHMAVLDASRDSAEEMLALRPGRTAQNSHGMQSSAYAMSHPRSQSNSSASTSVLSTARSAYSGQGRSQSLHATGRGPSVAKQGISGAMDPGHQGVGSLKQVRSAPKGLAKSLAGTAESRASSARSSNSTASARPASDTTEGIRRGQTAGRPSLSERDSAAAPNSSRPRLLSTSSTSTSSSRPGAAPAGRPAGLLPARRSAPGAPTTAKRQLEGGMSSTL